MSNNDMQSGNLILHVICKNKESNLIKSYFVLFDNFNNMYNIYCYIDKKFTSYVCKYTTPEDIDTMLQFIRILLDDAKYYIENNFLYYELYELDSKCFYKIIANKATNYINIKDIIMGGKNKQSFLLDECSHKIENETIPKNYLNMLRNISMVNKEMNPVFVEYKTSVDNKQDETMAAAANQTSVHTYEYPY